MSLAPLTPFKCEHCDKQIGETDGAYLYLNGVKVRGACGSGLVKVTCTCGKWRTWRACSGKPIANPEKVIQVGETGENKSPLAIPL